MTVQLLPRRCRWCGKPLKQNVNEPNYDFRARVYCNLGCAEAHKEVRNG